MPNTLNTLAAIREFERLEGRDADMMRHTPLHYRMADLVHALLVLAEKKGLGGGNE